MQACVSAALLRLPLASGLLVLRLPAAFAMDEAGPNSASYPRLAEAEVIHYDAPSECPTVNAYLIELEQRLGSSWETALRQLALLVNVSVTRGAGQYVGTLELVNERGERFSRAVSGTVCAEVVDGIGLMTAVAVRARFASGAEHGETSRSQNGGVSDPSASEASVEQRRPATVRREPNHSPSNARLRVGGRGSMSSGVGPGVALGAGAFAALELGKVRLGLAVDVFPTRNAQVALGRAEHSKQ